MSWNQYIDSLIGHTNDQNGAAHCDAVAILGLDGGAAWTSGHAQSLKISAAESATIAATMKNDPSGFQTTGVILDGQKYQFLRENEGIVLAKRKDCGSVTIQKSKTAVLIAHTKEGGQQGNTNKGCQQIADYLESVNM